MRRLILLLLGLHLGTALAAESIERGPVPDPRHEPRTVVQFQLEALKRVDVPVKDAGFAIVFRFSSPENRSRTGPLDHFAQMLRLGYGDLIEHRQASLPPTVQQGEQALQAVEVTDRRGGLHHYVFVLRRQNEGRYKGCWMTDAVLQPEGEQAPPQQEI